MQGEDAFLQEWASLLLNATCVSSTRSQAYSRSRCTGRLDAPFPMAIVEFDGCGESELTPDGYTNPCKPLGQWPSKLTQPPAFPFKIRNVVAPMVGQSDLAFRLLCRRHGADVAYTEMLFSERLADDVAYRERALRSCAEDRPLVVQLCGHDAAAMCRAAALAQDRCDAVDVNLGCPQERAMEGLYGAYLLDRPHWGTVEGIVRSLAGSLRVPVVCKIRLLPTLAMTLEFCKMLEAAGCAMLAVHGRTRGSPRMRRQGPADLAAVRAVRESVAIPVVSNGNVRCARDVDASLALTSADGVMSAEGILEDPLLFEGGCRGPSDRRRVALEYLELARRWESPLECARQHLGHMLGRRGRGGSVSFAYLGTYRRSIDLKRALDGALSLEMLEDVISESLGSLESEKRGRPK